MSKDSNKTTHFLGLATVITCLAMISLASIQPFQLTVLKAQETFFESSIQIANDTASTGQPQPRNQTNFTNTDPQLNNPFVRQGQISSQPTQLREDEATQSTVILPIRDDGAMYSGTLTYQSSKPVDVIVLNLLRPTNTTAIPEEFGNLDDIIRLEGQLVSVNEIGSGTSGSSVFTGNAIGLIAEDSDDEPFLVTYSINGVPIQARIINDITSILNSNATESNSESGSASESESESED